MPLPNRAPDGGLYCIHGTFPDHCGVCIAEYVNSLEAKLAALEWRPIKTAPKDGTEILGYWHYFYPGDTQVTEGQRVIHWESEWGGWDDGADTQQGDGLYSHWRPLPEPPNTATEDGK